MFCMITELKLHKITMLTEHIIPLVLQAKLSLKSHYNIQYQPSVHYVLMSAALRATWLEKGAYLMCTILSTDLFMSHACRY